MSRRSRFGAPVAAVALLVAVAACSGATGESGAPADGPTVAVSAIEYAFEPSTITVPAGDVTFEVTNDGSEEHEFEIFEGETVVDEVEGLVPGLSRSLTVALEAGDYTFVCKLADHEEQGMTGTLTVTER
jgi:iron uptake system component EfeO